MRGGGEKILWRNLLKRGGEVYSSILENSMPKGKIEASVVVVVGWWGWLWGGVGGGGGGGGTRTQGGAEHKKNVAGKCEKGMERGKTR